MTVKILSRAAFGALAFAYVDAAYAGSATWTNGSGTSLLNTPGNWTAGGPPTGSGEIATWNGTVAGNLTLTYNSAFGSTVATDQGVNVNITGTQTGSLQISIDAVNDTGSFQLGNIDIASGAGAFTLGGVATTSRVAFRNTSNLNTFTNNSSNVATFGSNITYFSATGSTRTLAFAGTGNWQVDSALGVSSGGFLVTKSGTGTLTLNGANTYTKGTTISVGTIKLGNATALGAAPVVSPNNPNAVSVAAGAVLDLNGQTITRTNALTLNGSGISSGGALINSNATAASYAGNVTLGSDSSIGGANGITLNGIIGGAFKLTKVGAGTLTLSKANTYSGATKVEGGTLVVAGSISSTAGTTVTNGALFVNGSLAGAVSVASGATLGGTNTLGAVTLATGAILAPGAATNLIGTLTLSGTAPALSGCQLVADVSTTSGVSDKLALSGTVDLTGLTVTVKIPGTLPDTNTYVVLSSTALSGTPTLAGDLSYPWYLSVKNNTLVLSKIFGTMISIF